MGQGEKAAFGHEVVIGFEGDRHFAKDQLPHGQHAYPSISTDYLPPRTSTSWLATSEPSRASKVNEPSSSGYSSPLVNPHGRTVPGLGHGRFRLGDFRDRRQLLDLDLRRIDERCLLAYDVIDPGRLE